MQLTRFPTNYLPAGRLRSFWYMAISCQRLSRPNRKSVAAFDFNNNSIPAANWSQLILSQETSYLTCLSGLQSKLNLAWFEVIKNGMNKYPFKTSRKVTHKWKSIPLASLGDKLWAIELATCLRPSQSLLRLVYAVRLYRIHLFVYMYTIQLQKSSGCAHMG